MSRNYNQQESMRLAAEKVRLQREKEEREDKELLVRICKSQPVNLVYLFKDYFFL